MVLLSNKRSATETKQQYRDRLRRVAKLVAKYLRQGRPATHSSKGRKYIPGPHKTHKPHEVKQSGMVLGPAGVPKPHTWTVMHPGTLVKA